MGSRIEPGQKRRHISSISSPTAASNAKKSPFHSLSEEKKLDAAVLQFQNQKLTEKLEVQKLEIADLENKLNRMREKQQPYENILAVVSKSWEELVSDLVTTEMVKHELDVRNRLMEDVGASLSQNARGALDSPKDPSNEGE